MCPIDPEHVPDMHHLTRDCFPPQTKDRRRRARLPEPGDSTTGVWSPAGDDYRRTL